MRERYTPGYKSGYIHSPNHRFSKCSNIRLFSVYNRGSQIFFYCSQRTTTNSLSVLSWKLSIGSLNNRNQRFLESEFFFPKELELPILWFWNVQRTVQHWFELWTKKMAKEIMIRERPLEVQTFQLQPSSKSTMKLVTFECKDYVEVGNQHP